MPSKQNTKPKYDFRTCLKKSEVLKPDVLEKWQSENPGQNPTDDACQLVRENLLTEWQAKYLLSGRYRLHLGNYQLLRRVRRDAFGDRFVALHPKLGRTVQVQVLPVELTNDPKQRSEFLKQAKLAGELDHPSLAHVFDIDKQQGRYYLVTEHTPGQSLAEFSEKSLDERKIARIVQDSISGLTYAHSRSVVHGNLSMDNVLIDENGQVKISQLALSPLVERASDAPKETATPEQADLLAIVRLGRRLLNRMEPSAATRQLCTLLTNLDTKDDSAFADALGTLKDWIDAEPIASTAKESVKGGVQAVATKGIFIPDPEIERRSKNARLTDKQKSKRSRRGGERNGDAMKSLVHAATSVLVMLAVGVAGYFGYRAFQQPDGTNTVAQNQTAIQKGAEPVSTSKSLIPANGSAEPKPNPDANATTNSSPSSRSIPPESAKPQTLFRDLAESGRANSELTVAAKSSDQADVTSAVEPTVETGGDFSNEPFSNVSGPDEGSQADKDPPSNPASMPQSSIERSASAKERADTGRESAEKKSEKKATGGTKKKSESAKPSGPFDGFPDSVDLPATETVENVVVAEIKQDSIYLLGMTLRSPEGVGKGRTNFELRRNETKKQQWSVIAKKSPKSDGDPVGQFEFDKPTGQIRFRWLPEAADSKIANYVRNCVLKLTLADDSWTLALRKPLSLPDLKLTREQPFAQLDSAIKWLPNPSRTTIELLPTRAAGLPKTWLDPAIVQPGSPSAIHFHEAISNRFMWLQLDADTRNEAKFDLRLMLKHVDGTVQPIARSDDLKKLAELLLAAAATAQQEYLTKNDMVAPYGQKTKFRDYVAKLKSKAAKTMKQSQIAAENIAIIENFYDRVIPVRVIFRSDDHRVVLVDTSPNADEDEKEDDSNE